MTTSDRGLLSAGVELEQYPKTATGNIAQTWVGYRKYPSKLDRAALIAEAKATLGWLKEKKIRGSGDIFIHPDIEIPNEVLEKCGKAHRNGGNCAEVMVIASWYRAKASLTKKLKGESKSIVTIGVDSDDVIDPCWVDPKKRVVYYGCKDFLKKKKWGSKKTRSFATTRTLISNVGLQSAVQRGRRTTTKLARRSRSKICP
ncbi:hypothetical protein JOM56_011333 [Amanita muscaria]